MHYLVTKLLQPSIKGVFYSAIILLSASFYCQAEVYKWTDKYGNTHYSDIKPNEMLSEKLDIKTTFQSQERESPQSAAQRLDQDKAKELQTQAEKLQSETQKRELDAQCQNIRNNLKTLQENNRIRLSKNGGVIRYLTPTEIENKKQTYLQQIREQCSN
tara:strand:+ start:4590 stop:5066 length:477 start_codon:yes stop_codon:yes gene_type:complete